MLHVVQNRKGHNERDPWGYKALDHSQRPVPIGCYEECQTGW
jgi:hypothetical protein